MPSCLLFTENENANRLLASNPLITLMGILLEQQFPMGWTFLSPNLLAERLGDDLAPETIATLNDAALAAVFKGPPALHRFPGSMGTHACGMCTT